MIGHLLMDKYKIERRLGQGAFGYVYRAFDTTLKRPVAVKILHNAGDDRGFEKRFLRESESMARLMHANVVSVFDRGNHENRPFMVMELVDGVTLAELIEDSPPGLGIILNISTQICQAMAYAHEHGVIHRDLKLTNIMVDKDGHAKVLDFGLAKVLDASSLSDDNSRIGTPVFYAPEQVAVSDIDNRADIWAFGVCLYRMLNGCFPFEAEHPATLLYLIASGDPAPFEPDVPEELRNVVLHCLEKKREDRYVSFSELGNELEALRLQYLDAGSSLVGRRAAARTTTNRGSKRNPYLNRVMIQNPNEFYGRSREIKRIYSRLDAPRPQSISIVGERRIGKSSLLNYIYQRQNRRQQMDSHHNAIFVYMDFQQGADLNVEKFIDILLGMFKYEKHRMVTEVSSERSFDVLRAEIEELNSQDKRVIILMDEFESITTNPGFDMQFFSFLRFLANNYKVAYVTSSYHDLQQMCHDEDIADSPFFNIFSTLSLRTFSRDEAVELICGPSQSEGIPLEPHIDNILGLSGYFPFFIQIACSAVFEYLAENEDGEPDWTRISEVFREEATQHYQYIWDRMDENFQNNLSRIAAGKKVDKKFRHVNDDLVQRGYLVESNGRMELFSKPFQDFVLTRAGGNKHRRSFLSSVFGKKSDRE
jgi:serine/threonine protein kinase